MNKKRHMQRKDEPNKPVGSKNNKYLFDPKELKRKLKGKYYLSYFELMNVIGEPKYKGNQKKAQMKALSRYIKFEYIPEDHKYIIYEVYSEPLPNFETRADAKRIKYIEKILMLLFKESQLGSIAKTKFEWWELLGMINSTYSDYYNAIINDKDLKEVINLFPTDKQITEWDINNFYKRSNKKFSEIFFHILEDLKDRMILDYKEVYLIKREQDSSYKVANPTEEENIRYCIGKAMDDFNLSHYKLSKLLNKKDLENFYNTISKYERDLYGYNYVIKEWQINITRQILDIRIKQIDDELNNLLTSSNTEFKTAIDKQAQTISERIYNERHSLPIGLKPFKDENDEHIYNDPQYINKQHIISDKLISI